MFARIAKGAKGMKNRTMPLAERTIGPCMRDLIPSEAAIRQTEIGPPDMGIWTDFARFQVHRNLLGKTNTRVIPERSRCWVPGSESLR